MWKFSFFVLLGFFTSLLTAQEISYPVSSIDESLFVNANAIIRNQEIEIEIVDIDKMIVNTVRTVTVLNKLGEDLVWAGEVYDDNTKLKKQQALIFDESGKEIKKFRKKDFQDRSLVTGATLISDARVSYIDYSPKVYPYTVYYTSEVQEGSTIFVRDWFPSKSYWLSVERSGYKLKNPAKIPIRFLEKNLASHKIEKVTSDYEVEYLIEQLPAYKYEKFSPAMKDFAPHVKVALNQFSLVGVNGEAEDWAQLGKWQYDNLLDKKMALPPKTIAEVQSLTADAIEVIEKARIIYNYVQENTRYVSVQLGIGGWEPMTASEVDHLKYGDCKALTTYTKALLESQNIPSYYTIVHGGRDMVDIDEDFASMEGNHVILNVPLEDESIWLECTSQTDPFNYTGGFTDGRKVLLVKPDGGEIVKTTHYSPTENLQNTTAEIRIDETGDFTADLKRESFGVPYGMIYLIANQDESEKELHYKEEFGHLKNLHINKIDHHNDRLSPKFSEQLEFKGKKYASVIGSRLLLPLSFSRLQIISVPRSTERKLPVKINRGMTFKDNYEFFLPQSSNPESIPENIDIQNEFGSFKMEIKYEDRDNSHVILVERNYTLNEGTWPAEKYSNLREFMNKLNSLSNQKAVIVLTN